MEGSGEVEELRTTVIINPRGSRDLGEGLYLPFFRPEGQPLLTARFVPRINFSTPPDGIRTPGEGETPTPQRPPPDDDFFHA